MILDIKQLRQQECDLHNSHQKLIKQKLCTFLTDKGYILCDSLGRVINQSIEAEYVIHFLKNVSDTRPEPKPSEPWRLPFVGSIEGITSDEDAWIVMINGPTYFEEMIALKKEIWTNFNVRTRWANGSNYDLFQAFPDDPDPYEFNGDSDDL